MNIEFKLVDASSVYKYNDKYDIYESMAEDTEFITNVYNNAIDLKKFFIVLNFVVCVFYDKYNLMCEMQDYDVSINDKA